MITLNSPVDNAHGATEDHYYNTENYDSPINASLKLSLSNNFQMEHGGERESNWRASHRAQYSKEFADVLSNKHSYNNGEKHEQESREILGPLPLLCFWPAAVESILHNQMCRIEYKWITKQ